MTVTNHRPFTYPDGRIDIPSSSHTREGAVKYTDNAIRKFITEASAKPWFANTIFVIVADHSSGSAGKTDLPIERYHIPCFIYAPSLIKPVIEQRLTSQIDLAPTVLGLMNISYKSRFMGYDINRIEPGRERVFVSTYQDMGYLKNDTLVILSPKKKVQMFRVSTTDQKNIPFNANSPLVKEAIAWYQSASYLFKNGKYKALH
jgi:phosphoglycerol transferase MdoB-like AlkP superfamily enzyme